jgi:hypothetical protein
METGSIGCYRGIRWRHCRATSMFPQWCDEGKRDCWIWVQDDGFNLSGTQRELFAAIDSDLAEIRFLSL